MTQQAVNSLNKLKGLVFLLSQGRRQVLLVGGGLNARGASREIFEATPTSGHTLYHARFHSMRTHVFGFRYHVHNKVACFENSVQKPGN